MRFGALALIIAAPCRADVNVSLGLLQAVKGEEDPVFAPMSVVDLMGLFYYGSNGQTRNQLAALFAGATQADVAAQAAKAQRTRPGYVRLGSVWFDDRVQVTTDFFKAAKDQWKMHISAAPLRDDIDKSVGQINFWYDQQTRGHFKNVLTPDMLSNQPDMIAVVVTAFKLPWEKDYFDAVKTKPATFYRSPEDKFTVQMMHDEEKFSYTEDEAFQTLRIPYKGGDFSLLLFLPRDARNFDKALAGLNGKYLTETLGKLKPTLINLSLPRVDFTTELNWRTIFLKSRIADAFTANKANFSRINDNNPARLYIAKFIEKLEIQWNEKGTEAKSMITVSNEPFGSPPKNDKAINFNANHPFVFIIYDNKAKDAAFAGVINAQSQMQSVEP